MKNSLYIFFALLLLSLAGGGIYYLVFLSQDLDISFNSSAPVYIPPTATPTIEEEYIPPEAITPTSDLPVSPTIISLSSTPIPTNTPKPTNAPATPTPEFSTYSNSDDMFSVVHRSIRKVYPDTESSGNRYTFYLQSANFAIHTGTTWSWSHPGRELNTPILDNQASFRYDISSQTLVDTEKNGKKYTIQCIHNGIAEYKSECEDFIRSFKFL